MQIPPFVAIIFHMIITAGIYKGRKVVAPDEKIVRPTLSKAREGIFSALFSMIDFEEKKFLDMFAGSGIMGLEAISRGFGHVLAIEKNPKVLQILKNNYKNIKIEPDVILGDSLKVIQKLEYKYDVIYIDPPYFSGVYEECLKKVHEHKTLNDGGVVILEHVTEIDWDSSDFALIKQKKYSGKIITFLKLN